MKVKKGRKTPTNWQWDSNESQKVRAYLRSVRDDEEDENESESDSPKKTNFEFISIDEKGQESGRVVTKDDRGEQLDYNRTATGAGPSGSQSKKISKETTDTKETPSEPVQEKLSMEHELTSEPETEMLTARVRSLEEDLKAMAEVLHEQVLAMASMRTKHAGTSKSEKFKAPRGHPVFEGDGSKLEEFILDMTLMHSEYTRGEAASEDNEEFISQLGPYFEGDAKTWFRLFAGRKYNEKKPMTWMDLMTELRSDYGGRHEAESRYHNYFNLKQTGDVNSYIAKKTAAALLAADDLNPRTELFGFLGGLKSDVQDYVRLQRPTTLREAEEIARAYENSLRNRKRKGESSPKRTGREQTMKKYVGDEISNHSAHQQALEEIRALRRNGCFKCGLPGHRRDDCKSEESVATAYQAKIDALKAIMSRRPGSK